MSEPATIRGNAIRVGVADKSPLVQAALTHLLTEDPRFDLVSVYADGESFLRAAELGDMQVAITGWIISPGDGKYILDQLRSRADAPRIVIYTGAEGESVAAQVMAHGAAAYVSKSEQPDYLLDTVAQVAEGRMVFPFLDVRQINQSPLTTLTRRELEVLSALAANRLPRRKMYRRIRSSFTSRICLKNWVLTIVRRPSRSI
jgi:two-component system nitrate/nitrite response regulator NarP